MANNENRIFAMPVSAVRKIVTLFYNEAVNDSRNVYERQSAYFFAETLKKRANASTDGLVQISVEEASDLLRELYARMSDTGKLKEIDDLFNDRG